MTELEKRTVGRPKLPETIIKELTEKIQALNLDIQNSKDKQNQFLKLAEIVRVIIRASKGLAPDEQDIFLGLTDIHDIRERTRLDEPGLLSHSAMQISALIMPETKLFANLADMEDHYYISNEGEGRKEAILTVQAKTKLDNNLILNMPNTQGGTAQTEQPQGQTQPQKKGIFARIFKR